MARKPPAGTPATRVLEASGVAWSAHPYAHDPRAASYGLEAAHALGVAPDDGEGEHLRLLERAPPQGDPDPRDAALARREGGVATKAELISTNLSNEQEAKLRAAFEEE